MAPPALVLALASLVALAPPIPVVVDPASVVELAPPVPEPVPVASPPLVEPESPELVLAPSVELTVASPVPSPIVVLLVSEDVSASVFAPSKPLSLLPQPANVRHQIHPNKEVTLSILINSSLSSVFSVVRRARLASEHLEPVSLSVNGCDIRKAARAWSMLSLMGMSVR